MPDDERDAAGEGWPEGFARSDEDRRAAIVLSALRRVTPRQLLELSHRVGAAGACLHEIRAGRAGTPGDRGFALREDGIALEEGISACGARTVTAGSEEYPRRLLDLTDPPAVLFVRGRALTEMDPAVAVVGARNCSVLGREVATDLGRQLAGAGVAVVSGGARGIDIAAHRGALAWRDGGRTVAVLGCGIDAPYPRSHEAELLRIAEVGCLISEYPPEVRPEPRNFPARNRIIAALADAVVVVEGARGSGSMITTEHALDLGRSIFAVPGSVTSPLSSVPLGLIRDGAVMIRGATDLLEDLGLAPASDPADEDVGGDASLNLPAGLSVEEVAVAETLAGPTLAEKVARSTGSSLQEALSLLLALELKGVVRNTGGRYELRLRPRDQA